MNSPLTRPTIKTRFTQPLFLFHVIAILVLWVFVWMHAFNMDITHDEAYSFRLVKTNYYRALFGTANTHWLNSFFMKLFSLMLGDSPGVLRLHLVLAFPFFAQAVYRLALLIDLKSIQVAFYALVLFNPYVLDFFSVARGYGLAVLFQAWTLIYLIKAADSPFHYRNWLMVILMCTLSIGSNLSYLYTVMGVGGLFILYILSSHPFTFLFTSKQVRNIWLLMGALMALAMADLLFVKYVGKDLGYGGDENFVASLFGSVWEASLYFAHYPYAEQILTWASFIMLSVTCVYFIIKQIRQATFTAGFVIGVPVAGILLLSIIFHLLSQTPYLLGRTALQWYVPGLLITGMALGKWWPRNRSFRAVATACAVVISAGIVFHFTRVASTTKCYEWYWLESSKRSLYDLYRQRPQHPGIGAIHTGVFINYYSLVDKQLSPYPVLLPETRTNIYPDSLAAALRETDYVITSFSSTQYSLEKSGVSWRVMTTYPNDSLKLLQIAR